MEKTIMSKRISAGTRIYYLDVHEDGKGMPYVAISEIPTKRAPKGKKRQRIFIHGSNVKKFAEAFNEFLKEIESNGHEEALL